MLFFVLLIHIFSASILLPYIFVKLKAHVSLGNATLKTTFRHSLTVLLLLSYFLFIGQHISIFLSNASLATAILDPITFELFMSSVSLLCSLNIFMVYLLNLLIFYFFICISNCYTFYFVLLYFYSILH